MNLGPASFTQCAFCVSEKLICLNADAVSMVSVTNRLNSLVHDVNTSGLVCVGNEFELEFGCQFDITSTNMADVLLFTPWRTRKRPSFSTDPADVVASMGLKDAPTSICCKVTDANTSLKFKIEPKWSTVIYIHSISYGVHGHFSQCIET